MPLPRRASAERPPAMAKGGLGGSGAESAGMVGAGGAATRGGGGVMIGGGVGAGAEAPEPHVA